MEITIKLDGVTYAGNLTKVEAEATVVPAETEVSTEVEPAQ